MSVSSNQLSMIFATEKRNFSVMFLVLRKFDLKEEKLELEYHN